jgi:hypothetical protein
VYFSINVDTKKWVLSGTLQVTDLTTALAYGNFDAQAGQWYALALRVDGTGASAWINGEQVGWFDLLAELALEEGCCLESDRKSDMCIFYLVALRQRTARISRFRLGCDWY